MQGEERSHTLANMRPRDFVFFTTYTLVGLVSPLSSFFTLMEYYRLQLRHLSLSSIALVAISSTSVRCTWGYDHRCGCSGASSCR
jgi:hypothetical protein